VAGCARSSHRSAIALAECARRTLIGSIRRECLDDVIILHESGLRRVLRSYFEYYERSRTHLGLGKDAPIQRAVEPPELGRVMELPQVGGLQHRLPASGSLN
jgi:putative transposase